MSEVILGTKCYGVEMSQTWEDLELYEKLLNHHRGLKSVVELGTGQGGFSLYLYYQCLRRGIKFATYDLVEPPVHVPGWQFMDVFAEHVVAREFIHPMLLICDNGNKPLEMQLYEPYIQQGDLLAVHDWGTEVNEEDVPDGLRPIHWKWCNSMTRVFTRG